MINIVQNENVYEVSFPYDPALVAMMKNVPGKQWLPTVKLWTIPLAHLGWFLKQLEGTAYEQQVRLVSNEHIGENASLEVTQNIPDFDLSGVQLHVCSGGKLYKHQIDFMKYALHRDATGHPSGFILADEPGAGKTLEFMNLALHYRKVRGFKHCLILCCVNTAKYNWMDDVVKHTDGQEVPYILGTRLRRDKKTERYDTGNKEKLEDLTCGHKYGDPNADPLPYMIIMNVEALHHGVRTEKKKQKHFPFTDMLIRLINSGEINMIGIDEVHKGLSPSSEQGKQILEIKEKTGRACYWMPITGTPITNRATDVYTPLKLVGGHSFSSYWEWCHQFCVYGGYGDADIIGYKNIPMLKSMLQGNMLRRLKKDFIDLPEKIYYTDYVENTPYQRKLYAAVVEDIRSQKGKILSSPDPRAGLLRLRQVNGSPEIIDGDCQIDAHYLSKNAKLQCVLDLLAENAKRGEKTLVFSNWVAPLRTLYKFVSKLYKTCCHTGTMTEAERQKHKRVFMNNPEYLVMLGTTGSMGTSHTLTAANNVIFYDEPWTPTDREQAIDRVHRPGATKTISIHVILAKGTVDDRVHNVLYTKEGISKYVVDNQLDLKNNPELFDLLLAT